jgi:hypothetical protein
MVWVATVVITTGLIYAGMWLVYGDREVAETFDGLDIVGYVGLAVILAPAVVTLLLSLWMDWIGGRWRAD